MNIGTKITLLAGAGVALATAGSIAAVYSISRANRVAELRSLMSATIRQAEGITRGMDEFHRSGAFNTAELNAELARAGADYRGTRAYRTIPVVAGWESIRTLAEDKGMVFRTPSRPDVPARNPANAGREYADIFRAFEQGAQEYFLDAGDALVLARPARLAEGCLRCHGEAAGGGGRDVTGHEAEKLRLGDVKGAYLLRAPMGGDPVVRASVNKISLVGLLVLAGVLVGFLFLNRKLILLPLERAAAELEVGAEEIRSAASQVDSAGQSLAAGASEQAATLDQTADRTRELAAMTNQNAENGQRVTEHMAAATGVGRKVEAAAAAMAESMVEIDRSSESISRIVKLIDEMAFQTNVLALNAAVEAARAGEAGLGFAVVADEVRSLAQRSAEAARETTELIGGSLEKTRQGKVRLEGLTGALAESTRIFAKVTDLSSEVSSASVRQAAGIRHIADAVTEMQSVTQGNAAAAEQSAAAAQELTAQTGALRDLVARLRAVVDGAA